MAEQLEQLTTRIAPDVSRRLRMLAAEDRRPMYDIVNEALREYLDRQERGDA